MEGEMDIKVNFSGRAIRYTEEEIAVVVEASMSVTAPFSPIAEPPQPAH